MANKTHVYDGSWREVKKIYVYDSDTTFWRLVKYSHVWDGTAWRQVHTNAYIFNKTFSTPASNYDLMNDIKSMPAPTAWNGTDDIEATITVNPGVTVFSSVSGSPGYAMRIAPNPSTYPGTTIPAASTISLKNYGYIVGKGGDGGDGGGNLPAYGGAGLNGSAGSPALILGTSTTVTNYPGSIIASGGGGGGGGGAAVSYNNFGKGGVYGAAAGGSGGGGGGNGSPAGSTSSKGAAGISPALFNPAPSSGSPGNAGNDGSTSAGAGGAPVQVVITQPDLPANQIWTATGGSGGSGGARGSAGAAGAAGTFATSGPRSPLTIAATGGGGSGGATGSSIIGTSFLTPASSVTPGTNVFGPSTA